MYQQTRRHNSSFYLAVSSLSQHIQSTCRINSKLTFQINSKPTSRVSCLIAHGHNLIPLHKNYIGAQARNKRHRSAVGGERKDMLHARSCCMGVCPEQHLRREGAGQSVGWVFCSSLVPPVLAAGGLGSWRLRPALLSTVGISKGRPPGHP